jgi:hypothetical protein
MSRMIAADPISGFLAESGVPIPALNLSASPETSRRAEAAARVSVGRDAIGTTIDVEGEIPSMEVHRDTGRSHLKVRGVKID